METKTAELSIEDFCARGYGLAQLDRSPIEVAHAIPGDRVKVEVNRRSRRVKKGRLLELLSPSSDRVSPRCAHASMCGGCCWQSMNYDAQTAHKQAYILRAFGDLIDANIEILPMISCAEPWNYRNKMEFSFSQNRAGMKYLGLMIAHAEPYVFNLDSCHIAPPWMSECLSRVRAWWEQSGVMAYYPPQDSGSLRYLTLREAVRSGQKMAILNISGQAEFAIPEEQVQRFNEAVGSGIGVFLRTHQICKGVPTRFVERHLSGPEFIVEKMHLTHGDLEFKISPASFFQPHTIQAEKLYDAAVSMLDGERLVYDLYCGTGTLGMAASRSVLEVIGIEMNPEAVKDAEENARRNHLSNIRFVQGDAGAVMTRLLSQSDCARPDAVIVDPPRAGLDSLTLHHLQTLRPKKIIYVSCNPVTQADNIRKLVGSGYAIQRLQAVDQFPHTAHIENIALLTRVN
ncbi:MAG: rumA1 [Parachlamydiales bacterium]|nr:rumA1 [Parachlamydiales bacterium]